MTRKVVIEFIQLRTPTNNRFLWLWQRNFGFHKRPVLVWLNERLLFMSMGWLSLNCGHQRAYCSPTRCYVSVGSHGGMMLTGAKSKNSKKNLSQCHFAHHKSQGANSCLRGERQYLTAWAISRHLTDGYFLNKDSFQWSQLCFLCLSPKYRLGSMCKKKKQDHINLFTINVISPAQCIWYSICFKFCVYLQ
jgi:hypothetical protein